MAGIAGCIGEDEEQGDVIRAIEFERIAGGKVWSRWRQRWCWRWRWRRAGVVWCGRGGGDGNIISGLSVISNALALRLRFA